MGGRLRTVTSTSAGGLRPIEDRSGYRITHDDLTFLCLSPHEIRLWQSGEVPLGLTKARYAELIESLVGALAREGITEADVRLQGSAAHFWSSAHKAMPMSSTEVVTLFLNERGWSPTAVQLKEICSALDSRWPAGSRPTQRPFDSLYRLGISNARSDLDLQISSDELVERARALFSDLGLPARDFWVRNKTYGFVQKSLVEQTAPYLRAWTNHRSDVVGREVTVAVFPSKGPKASRQRSDLSAHFKPSDWKIDIDGERR